MLVALVSSALAQDPADWIFPNGNVVRPSQLDRLNSAGHPSVVYDLERNRYIMIFEELTQQVDATCPQGIWRIRAATSPDGLAWTVLQPGPSILPGSSGPDLPTGDPGSGTYYSCVAANPTAVYSDVQPLPNRPRGLLTIFFKAEQDSAACDAGPQPWGCDTYTGLGRATYRFNVLGNLVGISVPPATAPVATLPILTGVPGATLGQPHAIKAGGLWRVAVQGYPSIYEATGTQSGSLTVGADPILDFWTYHAPVVPWVENELFNPSYLCDDDGDSDHLALFVGGRDTNAGQVVDGAWAKAPGLLSTMEFALDSTPQVQWGSNEPWRHWEVTGLTNGEYVVYYSNKNNQGRNVIKVGSTVAAWSGSDVRSRNCD